MSNYNLDKNLNQIKTQIELLKIRLEGLDKTLNLQEKVLDIIYMGNLMTSNLKPSILDSLGTEDPTSVEKIMKKAFSKGSIPKILFKEPI